MVLEAIASFRGGEDAQLTDTVLPKGNSPDAGKTIYYSALRGTPLLVVLVEEIIENPDAELLSLNQLLKTKF